MSSANPVLFFRRPEVYYARFVPVYIFINGQNSGSIKRAPGTLEISLPGPGKYQVYFELEWCRSAIHITPNMAYGAVQSLRIEYPNLMGLSVFLALVDSKNFGQLVPERRGSEKIE